MQNWYDSLRESDEAKWIKPDKATACLRASLSPAARTVYKHSLDLSEADLKKPHSVVNALRGYYGASVGVSGERQKLLRLLQQENESIASWETRIRNQAAQCEYQDFTDEFMKEPIYCRPNIRRPSSEVNRQGAQARNHSSKGETTRSGRSRQNNRANHVRESATENSQKYTAGAG